MKNPTREGLNNLIKDNVRESVWDAFKQVDRREFVPEKFKKSAYSDYSIELGKDSSISQPSLIADMIDLLDLKGSEKVLEIGTGSGYSSAILSFCAFFVFTIEINRNLAEKAVEKLRKYKNLKVYAGDGFKGLKREAPFDAVLINAAVKNVPKDIFTQLNEKGKIVAPIEEGKEEQMLCLFEKRDGKLLKETICPVKFVKLI
jgi:protein-L-isoaspartate(D-aspartate) O-methyltransferase